MGAVIDINDIRRAGYCARGVRQWFGANGLSFRDLLAGGVTEDAFLATGDPQAARVVAVKREREGRTDGR